MEKQRKVTMQTVADEAGVSKATVSRAIGNYPDILVLSPEVLPIGFPKMWGLSYQQTMISL